MVLNSVNWREDEAQDVGSSGVAIKQTFGFAHRIKEMNDGE
jgi:hypothetical protein